MQTLLFTLYWTYADPSLTLHGIVFCFLRATYSGTILDHPQGKTIADKQADKQTERQTGRQTFKHINTRMVYSRRIEALLDR
jgi:hypothetical protein